MSKYSRAVPLGDIFSDIDSKFAHPQIQRSSRVEGNSPVGKNLREEQFFIHNFSRQQVFLLTVEEDLWYIIPSGRDSKFSQSSTLRCLSVVGSSPFGKHMRDGQFCSTRDLSKGDKAASGNEISLGHLSNFNSWRDMRLCNPFGSSSRLAQSCIFRAQNMDLNIYARPYFFIQGAEFILGCC